MSIEIVVDDKLSKDKWESFLEQEEDANIFHTPEMFEICSKTKKYKPHVIASIDANTKEVLALLATVEISLKSGLLSYFTTRSVSFGSILYKQGPTEQDAVSKLLQEYKRSHSRKSMFSCLRNINDTKAVQPILEEHKFLYEPHLNYILSLGKTEEELMKVLNRNIRTHVRSNKKNNRVKIEEVTKLPELSEWYDCLKKTHQRKKIPLVDISLFENAFKIIHPKNLRFTMAKKDEKTIGVLAHLIYRKRSYAWFAGFDYNYRNYYPSELLFWESIGWAKENACKIYDFGGAGHPNEKYKVRDFKKKFGGDEVEYGRYTHISAPIRCFLAKKAYKYVKRIILS